MAAISRVQGKRQLTETGLVDAAIEALEQSVFAAANGNGRIYRSNLSALRQYLRSEAGKAHIGEFNKADFNHDVLTGSIENHKVEYKSGKVKSGVIVPPISVASPPQSSASPPLTSASPPLSSASPPLSSASPLKSTKVIGGTALSDQIKPPEDDERMPKTALLADDGNGKPRPRLSSLSHFVPRPNNESKIAAPSITENNNNSETETRNNWHPPHETETNWHPHETGTTWHQPHQGETETRNSSWHPPPHETEPKWHPPYHQVGSGSSSSRLERTGKSPSGASFDRQHHETKQEPHNFSCSSYRSSSSSTEDNNAGDANNNAGDANHNAGDANNRYLAPIEGVRQIRNLTQIDRDEEGEMGVGKRPPPTAAHTMAGSARGRESGGKSADHHEGIREKQQFDATATLPRAGNYDGGSMIHPPPIVEVFRLGGEGDGGDGYGKDGGDGSCEEPNLSRRDSYSHHVRHATSPVHPSVRVPPPPPPAEIGQSKVPQIPRRNIVIRNRGGGYVTNASLHTTPTHRRFDSRGGGTFTRNSSVVGPPKDGLSLNIMGRLRADSSTTGLSGADNVIDRHISRNAFVERGIQCDDYRKLEKSDEIEEARRQAVLNNLDNLLDSFSRDGRRGDDSNGDGQIDDDEMEQTSKILEEIESEVDERHRSMVEDFENALIEKMREMLISIIRKREETYKDELERGMCKDFPFEGKLMARLDEDGSKGAISLSELVKCKLRESFLVHCESIGVSTSCGRTEIQKRLHKRVRDCGLDQVFNKSIKDIREQCDAKLADANLYFGETVATDLLPRLTAIKQTSIKQTSIKQEVVDNSNRISPTSKTERQLEPELEMWKSVETEETETAALDIKSGLLGTDNPSAWKQDNDETMPRRHEELSQRHEQQGRIFLPSGGEAEKAISRSYQKRKQEQGPSIIRKEHDVNTAERDEWIGEPRDERIGQSREGEIIGDLRDERLGESRDERLGESRDERLGESRDERLGESRDERLNESRDERLLGESRGELVVENARREEIVAERQPKQEEMCSSSIRMFDGTKRHQIGQRPSPNLMKADDTITELFGDGGMDGRRMSWGRSLKTEVDTNLDDGTRHHGEINHDDGTRHHGEINHDDGTRHHGEINHDDGTRHHGETNREVEMNRVERRNPKTEFTTTSGLMFETKIVGRKDWAEGVNGVRNVQPPPFNQWQKFDTTIDDDIFNVKEDEYVSHVSHQNFDLKSRPSTSSYLPLSATHPESNRPPSPPAIPASHHCPPASTTTAVPGIAVINRSSPHQMSTMSPHMMSMSNQISGGADYDQNFQQYRYPSPMFDNRRLSSQIETQQRMPTPSPPPPPMNFKRPVVPTDKPVYSNLYPPPQPIMGPIGGGPPKSEREKSNWWT